MKLSTVAFTSFPFFQALSCLFLAVFSAHSSAAIVWHWQDTFSTAEQAKLQSWVNETYKAVEDTVAPFPFDVHIYFHRRDGAEEPVPWAHTERIPNKQDVHFHVDTGFSKRRFLEDWTGAHEISHLLIPYLGRKNAWFAEGFASYLQYQVHYTMGIINETELAQMYLHRFKRARGKYNLNDVPFAYSGEELVRRYDYPTMYWGGAAYFFIVEQELKRKNTSLMAVLNKYVRCCRNKNDSIDQLVARLDTLSGTNIFSYQLAQCREEKGFPKFEMYLNH